MKKLRIYYKEQDKIEHKNVKKYIYGLLEEIGIKGATIYESIYSYGPSGRVSNEYIEVESYNPGMKMEIVDEDEKINTLVDRLKDKNIHIVISDCEIVYG